MSDAHEPPEGTRVVVELPAPLDVVSTLLRVIGQTYPGTVIAPGWSGRTTFVIPDVDRPRPVDEVNTTPDDAADVTLNRWGKDGMALGLEDAVFTFLTEPVLALLDEYGIENYLEQGIVTEDGRRYVVVMCRSSEQTPHALRARAETEARAAEARARDAEERAQATEIRARAAERDARALREELRTLTLALGRATVLDDARALDALRALAREHLGPQRAPEPTTTARTPRAEGESS
ncbi:hypothetical protein ACFCZ3_20310 [Cellulosimicrobium cellulans]|uniref:hypothetical protein n=1 Tax=Cellulosimicrobium cellulans TaxID=1710 RepID=UPI0035D5334C